MVFSVTFLNFNEHDRKFSGARSGPVRGWNAVQKSWGKNEKISTLTNVVTSRIWSTWNKQLFHEPFFQFPPRPTLAAGVGGYFVNKWVGLMPPAIMFNTCLFIF